ncbi:MAG: polyphosphate kinase 2 family protein [Methanoregulaceae archaeon]|nr:polyphosphate kinase 2 family protein [Methanoregulaceae archaeon]
MMKKKYLDRLRIDPGERVNLNTIDTKGIPARNQTISGTETAKERAEELLEASRAELAKAQGLLWANNIYSILIILQGMDTAGKDGTIKHVMSGINPQGCRVHSFGVPTEEELDHDFLWRTTLKLPGRGEIGIFNRSYYEELLVVKVHPEVLARQRIPPGKRGQKFWEARYEDINAFERYLTRNGTIILKFFLHISKEEQRERLLERLDNGEKYWKFSSGDLAEREYWEQYQEAYERMLERTSSKEAPWYVIPADYKWLAWTLVADIISSRIQALDLHYPIVSDEKLGEIRKAQDLLRDQR